MGVAQVVVLAGEQAPGKGVIVDGIPVLRVPSWPRKRDYYIAPGDCGCDQTAQMGPRASSRHPHTSAIARHDLCTTGRHPLSGHFPYRRALSYQAGTSALTKLRMSTCRHWASPPKAGPYKTRDTVGQADCDGMGDEASGYGLA